MMMGLNDFSAKEVINILGVDELEKIFKFFGEEKEARNLTSVSETFLSIRCHVVILCFDAFPKPSCAQFHVLE